MNSEKLIAVAIIFDLQGRNSAHSISRIIEEQPAIASRFPFLRLYLSGMCLLALLPLLGACGSGGDAEITAAPTSGASQIALPRTGQTNCYDLSVSPQVVACNTAGIAPGQDGALQTGVVEPSPRFVAGTATMAECVTDNLTGLMWPANANLPAGGLSWELSLDFANTLDLCGHSNWRLPNRKELRSLIDYNLADNASALNAKAFSGVQIGFYWTSSSFADRPGDAWIVNMLDGSQFAFHKSNGLYVWPVRAGQ